MGQNSTVNSHAGSRYGKGAPGPKDSDMGKSTAKDATNVISKPGCNPPESSPSSTKQSKNTGGGKGSYGK